MQLIERLGLDPARDRTVALAGSGGKTSLLYLLARLYRRRGLRAAATTTTHIFPPDAPDLRAVTDAPSARRALESGLIPVWCKPLGGGKCGFPGEAALDALRAMSDILLIEADGSRRLPVKFPNATEPVIPGGAGRVVAVAGLSALGRPLAEVCHRPELACAALGVRPDQPVTPEIVAELLRAGYGRHAPAVLLNQADTPALLDSGNRIAALLRGHGIGPVVVTSLKLEEEQLC